MVFRHERAAPVRGTWWRSCRKDEVGARQLGMSARTYPRHVADRLRTLGASSRPTAALLARERGCI
ncbi:MULTISPECIES: hypothetical protein [Streptomyces]|uniref:hypothetical protein n=1 Tax=Streptomyces TaxID=1883 RepID=UPI0013B432B1|nr:MULTISPECIES: hypothetical protein [Streptomyces]